MTPIVVSLLGAARRVWARSSRILIPWSVATKAQAEELQDDEERDRRALDEYERDAQSRQRQPPGHHERDAAEHPDEVDHYYDPRARPVDPSTGPTPQTNAA